MPTRRAAVLVPALLIPAVVAGCGLDLSKFGATNPAGGKPFEFTSAQWKFTARFPAEPSKSTQNAPVPGGRTVPFTMFTAEFAGKDAGCVVGVADVPVPAGASPTMLDAMLDGARDGAVKNVKAKLTRSREVTLDGKYPGREFTATFTQPVKGQLRARIFLAGNRLYQVFVVGADEGGAVGSAEATAFLDSFAVTE